MISYMNLSITFGCVSIHRMDGYCNCNAQNVKLIVEYNYVHVHNV